MYFSQQILLELKFFFEFRQDQIRFIYRYSVQGNLLEWLFSAGYVIYEILLSFITETVKNERKNILLGNW